LIGAGILFPSTSYSELDKEFITQAKINTEKRFIDYHADELREFILGSNPHLSSQEIELIITDALKQRAECEVDATIALAEERSELSLAALLNDLAGRESGDTGHLTWSRVTKDQHEDAVRHCMEQHYTATTL
jgi:hypothetical protein